MQIDQTLQFLISNDTPFICLVHGAWGVGKTRYIKDLVATQRDGISKPIFSYVSLFGLDSIAAIEQAIFLNSLPLPLLEHDPHSGPAVQRRAEDLLSRMRPLLSLTESVSLDNIAHLRSFIAATAAQLLNHDLLIVVDDLERHSPAVSVSDILGFLMQLRDERHCQIVLVMNEEVLKQEAGTARYIENKEKLIDVELTFAHGLDEAVAIGLGDEQENRVAAECCRRLAISNIRTIEKIRDYLARFRAFVSASGAEAPAAFDARVQSTMVLAVWSHWQHAIALGEVKELQPGDLLNLHLVADQLTPDERQLYALLSDYGYSYTDVTDRLVISFVEQGMVEGAELAAAVHQFGEELARRQRAAKVEEAWQLYRGSLSPDTEAVANALYAAHLAGVEEAQIVSLDAAVRILTEVGQRIRADELIEKFFARKARLPSYGSFRFADWVQDAKLVERWQRQSGSLPDHRSLAETIASFFGGGDDLRRDIEKLASFTERDFYDFFTSQQGPRLFAYIKGLSRIEWQLSDEKNAIIEQNVRAALQRIAEAAPINRIRLRELLR